MYYIRFNKNKDGSITVDLLKDVKGEVKTIAARTYVNGLPGLSMGDDLAAMLCVDEVKN